MGNKQWEEFMKARPGHKVQKGKAEKKDFTMDWQNQLDKANALKPIQEVLRVSVDDPSPATVTQKMVAEDGKEEAEEWKVNMVAWTEEIRQIILTAPRGTFGTLLPRPPPRPLGNKAVEAAIPPIAVPEGRGNATSEAKAEEPTADTQKAAPASFKSRRILVGAKDECLPTEERRARSCDHCGQEEIGKGCK
jgi:hypothetical protein